MPAVYSGHNGFWFWGHPRNRPPMPSSSGKFSPAELATGYAHCKVAGTVQTPPGVDNDLTDTPIHRAPASRQPWSVLWPQAATLHNRRDGHRGQAHTVAPTRESGSLEVGLTKTSSP